MKELLEQLKSKAGLDDSQAGGAIETVIEFIKEKLPEPFASQIEKLLEGDGEEGGGIGDLADKAKDALGGIFGGGDDK